MVYELEDVLKSTLSFFNGNDLASDVWINKYAMKDKGGNFLEKTPEDTHRRMAKEFARIENKYSSNSYKASSLSKFGQNYFSSSKNLSMSEDEIFSYFKNFDHIIPQGSVMAILGNPYVFGSLSNCVVVDSPYDSYSGIFFSDQQLAQLFKRRCGVGIDISTLRPQGTAVSNAAGTSTGAVSFMERFSNTTREVAQNGRRGALMITMDIKHPDAEQFALIKQDLKKITGANISLRISDEFMEAVEKNTEFVQQWPIDSNHPEVVKTINAQDLWNKIVKCAHNTAEPGLIFWDRHHHYSTSSIYPNWKNSSTNPCGELPLNPNDSCRLITLNMFGSVDSPFTKSAKFNYERWYDVVYKAQRLMDDLVDLEIESIDRIINKIDSDKEPEHIKATEKQTWIALRRNGMLGRRTGLGFTGLGDVIAALGFKFDSDQAMNVTNEIMKMKCLAEFESSIDMAIERGAFTDYNSEIELQSDFVKMFSKEFPSVYDRMSKYGRRNISISTVAPNGSTAIISQTSSGIEPAYMLSYKRRRKVHDNSKVDFVDSLGDKWQEYDVFHPKLKEWMKITGESDFTKSPYFGSTAEEIDWIKRVEMQSIVQKWTTHSISSTINLPENVLVDKVAEIYLKSWKSGLKGITIYRSGARSGVLTAKEEAEKELFEEHHAPKRPRVLDADVVRFINNGEKWVAFVGLYEGKPYEIFTGKQDKFVVPNSVDYGSIRKIKIDGKSKYNFIYKDKDVEKQIEALNEMFNEEFWNYGRFISATLRHGMPTQYAVQLVSSLNFGTDELNSWKNGVSRALKKYVKDGTQLSDSFCQSCKDSMGLIYVEGCVKCKSCGWSKC